MQPEPTVELSTRRGRRRLKSALYIAYWSAALLLISSSLLFAPADAFSTGNRSGLTQRKSEWIQRSVQYYSTVMRKNAGSTPTQLPKTQMDSTTVSSTSEMPLVSQDVVVYEDEEFARLATKHYYARFLVKEGKWEFAEKLYRRIIDELTSEDDNCDHTKLAVSTLLLALHMQRTGDIKATRAVFLAFFRRVALAEEEEEELDACSCSAKVLQAYALFEMKNGHSAKSLEIIQRAVKMDEQLSPVLGWKQFRDAAAGREYSPTFSFRKTSKSKEGGGLSP